MFMRFSPAVLALGLAASTLSVAVAGQRPDDQIIPLSLSLQKQGEAALAAGQFMAADDALETALAVDPRNRGAFVSLAKVAIKQKLYGKAVKLTNRALVLEPTDRNALLVQGEAMMDQGAVKRAQENLAKLQKICAGSCPEASKLSALIQKGPAMAEAQTLSKADKD
jgi:tetratricopeptide (TPR) repeat protein